MISTVHLPILFGIHVFSDCTHNNYHIADESDEEDLSEGEMVTILSFFNDCSLQELTSVPTLSAKKAEKIIKMRPFDSWNDLVRTFLLPNNMLYPLLHYIYAGCIQLYNLAVIERVTTNKGVLKKARVFTK